MHILCFIRLSPEEKIVTLEGFKLCFPLPTVYVYYSGWSCGHSLYSFLFCVFCLSDAIRTKRLSLGAPRSNISTEDKGKETERKMKTKDHDMPGVRHLYYNMDTDILTGL